MSGYPIPKLSEDSDVQSLSEPIRSVTVLGHGDLAERQKPVYEHWLKEGVEVHCADTDPSKLEDCIEGINRYVLPHDEQRLVKTISDGIDLLCVNTVPELHLVNALQWGTFARQIIIQKPQDLNFPLIKTIARARGYEDFRRKSQIHDHYRNKGVVPALWHAVPALLTERGQFRRMLFILTESKSVNEERHRAASLTCGMIQDLAVHTIDLLLETLLAGARWRDVDDAEKIYGRVNGEIQVMACHRLREMYSVLGIQVETFAAIDLHIVERIEFPFGQRTANHWVNEFDVLIVVGKGLSVEQGISGDVKVAAIEFERQGGFDVWIDLKSLAVQGFQNHLPQGGGELNRHHGGLNRPFFLISPNPPKHALIGMGGRDYQQYQTLSMGGHVAENTQMAIQKACSGGMWAYPRGRPLGDLLRELAAQKQVIRPVWRDLEPLTRYLSNQPLPDEYYD
jgi:hypothetical protein